MFQMHSVHMPQIVSPHCKSFPTKFTGEVLLPPFPFGPLYVATTRVVRQGERGQGCGEAEVTQ